jgi:RNA polymerase sigma-70 factor (ECF subfamily)
VELAFVAALQHLPATQRAVLILREVLGFSAKEVAETLETSVASVNSALQRARAAVEERVPEESQQATLRSLRDGELGDLVQRYVDAWERCDVEAFTAMLAEDATFAMPPLQSWYQGREEIAIWAAQSPMSGDWRWRTVPARANGQPALAFYAWDASERSYLPFALNVLTFRGREITNVTAFIARSVDVADEEINGRWPEQPSDPELLLGAFGRFGLPERLA